MKEITIDYFKKDGSAIRKKIQLRYAIFHDGVVIRTLNGDFIVDKDGIVIEGINKEIYTISKGMFESRYNIIEEYNALDYIASNDPISSFEEVLNDLPDIKFGMIETLPVEIEYMNITEDICKCT